MKEQINLLPEKARLKLVELGKLNQIKARLILLGVVFSLIVAFVFFIEIHFKKQYLYSQSRLQLVSKKAAEQEEAEWQVFLLKQRGREITKILKERKNFGRLLWEIIAVLPAGALVENAQIDEKGIQIVFKISDYQQAGRLIDSFPVEEIEKLGGKEVSFSSVAREEKGGYLIDLRAGF